MKTPIVPMLFGALAGGMGLWPGFGLGHFESDRLGNAWNRHWRVDDLWADYRVDAESGKFG